MMKRFPAVPATILTLTILLGCSGTGSPTIPQAELSDSSQTVSSVCSSQQLWGMWEISLDSENGVFEPVPIRGAMFQANVTQFMQPPSSPTHCLSIVIDPMESDPSSGYIVCDITLQHPFPGLYRFRGFDVRGIAMGDANHAGQAADGELWPEPDELRLLNADGYSRWWNPDEFTTFDSIFGFTHGGKAPAGFEPSGTVNGYKYFADSLGAEDPLSTLDLDTRGTFSVDPGLNTRRYELQFPMSGGTPVYLFNYAITAGYANPITDDDPEYPIESFAISANQAEAFLIDITDNGSTAYYENSSSFGGNLNLEIEVFDWGLGAASTVTDEIAGVTLESPTLFSGQIAASLGDFVPGSTGYSWVLPILIEDVTPTAVDGQEIMIRVLSTSPSDYAPDLPGTTGFDYPEDAPLAAYLLWGATISSLGPSNENAPEVGEIDGPTSVLAGDDAEYTLSYATDVEDGTNLTILWDNDGDSVFDDDLDGDDTDLHATLNFPSKGSYQVIARAVDSGDLYTDSDPYDVYADECPTAIHNNFQMCMLGDAPGGNRSRMGSAFLTQGDYAGQLVVMRDNLDVRRYDVSGSSPWTGQPFISIHDYYNASDLVTQLDVCDYSGRVIIVCMNAWANYHPDWFQVYDSDGNWLTTMSVGGSREVCALDTDENGDLFIATYDNSGGVTRIQHFEYQASSPYYVEDPSDACITTAQFPGNCQFWDIAVAYTLDRVYALRGNYGNPVAPYGEMYCYDIAADGSLSLNNSIQDTQLFPDQVIGAYPLYYGELVDGDIEIDHGSEVSEECRIIVMAHRRFVAGHYIGVMDSDLNFIDIQTITPYARRYSISLRSDADPSQRPIFTSGYSSGQVYLSQAPSGW